jgi:hypothetical protein
VGQAFLYDAVTFNLALLVTTFYGVSSGFAPVFSVIFAAGNFMGPLLLGRVFDKVGRRPLVAAGSWASAPAPRGGAACPRGAQHVRRPRRRIPESGATVASRADDSTPAQAESVTGPRPA